MYQLDDQQVDFIDSDLRQRGIRTESLRLNLLDHICILVEENLGEEDDFHRCYAAVIRSFYKNELRELEEETHLLMVMRKGHLLLNRVQFFLLLFTLLIGPFIMYDLVWMVNAAPVTGWRLPTEIWAGTLVFALFPLLILLVLFLTPDRFDPLIPRGARVLLGYRPLIRILPVEIAR